jgi:hypothetical protein
MSLLGGRVALADAAMDVARQVRPRLTDLRRHRHAVLLSVRAKHSKLTMSLISTQLRLRRSATTSARNDEA